MILAAAFLAAAAPQACPEPRVLIKDASLGKAFGIGSVKLAELEASVRAGFAQACDKGILNSEFRKLLIPAGRPFIEPVNLPEANVALVRGAWDKQNDWHLFLEYPYVGNDRTVRVPTAAEVEEAIYCVAVGASAKEQEESGRCLAD